MVTASLPCRWNPGRKRAARSRSRTAPSSTSTITLGAVAITLVSEARSKIVSTVIGSRAGRSERWPNALR